MGSPDKQVTHKVSRFCCATVVFWKVTESPTFTGSEKERSVFKYAITRDYTLDDTDEETEEDDEDEEIDEPSEDEEVEPPGENEVTEETHEEGGTEETDEDEDIEEEDENAGTDGKEATNVEEETPVTIPPLSIRFEEVRYSVYGHKHFCLELRYRMFLVLALMNAFSK